MTGPDPTLIKANPPAGSVGQPPTSETFVEVTHHVESGLDSSITESKTELIMDSPPITQYTQDTGTQWSTMRKLGKK